MARLRQANRPTVDSGTPCRPMSSCLQKLGPDLRCRRSAARDAQRGGAYAGQLCYTALTRRGLLI
jgi:hypothetical protein